MRSCLYWFSLTLGVLLATQAARADSVTFTVTPSAVSGPAGSTVGWGYSITNNSATDYLDVSGIDAGLFTDGEPDSTIFFNTFLPLAPGATATQLFDNTAGLGGDIEGDLGLFQLTWDADAPVGAMNVGTFGLSGAFCDPSDMFCAEDFDVPSTDLAFADYSATVSSNVGTPAPEPSTVLLLVSGLCGIGLWSWWRQRNSGAHPANQ